MHYIAFLKIIVQYYLPQLSVAIYMTPKGFAEMSLHQDKIDDASLLECHRCDALVIIGWDNKRC